MPSESNQPDDPGRLIRTHEIVGDPYAQFPVDIPFIRAMGLRLAEFGDKRATILLEPQDWHQNSFQMAHGGVVMTMLDIGMAMAARADARDDDDDSRGLITIEMKTTFLQPARSRRIRSRGVCVHRTGSMAFCEAQVIGDDDAVFARASGTFKYMKKRRGQPADAQARANGQEKT